MMTQITKWLCGRSGLLWTFSLKLFLRLSRVFFLFFWKLARVQTLFCECFISILGVAFLRPGDVLDIVFQTFDSVVLPSLIWNKIHALSLLKYTLSGLRSQTVLWRTVCIHPPLTWLKYTWRGRTRIFSMTWPPCFSELTMFFLTGRFQEEAN